MDWVAIRNLHRIRPLFLLAAFVTFGAGWVGVMRLPALYELPLTATILGWIALTFFCSLLIYSLFIEIPARTTYIDGGKNVRLVTTGTYALTRHPGVLWFAGLVLSMLLINPSKTTLVAGVSWLSADILLVLAEDLFFFPRMFPTYSTYQSSTPFLLPNRQSLRRGLDTLPLIRKSRRANNDLHARKVSRNEHANEKSSIP
jgi:protein-S-isoprenylcysteine O-methyltransferase Ste14